MLVDSHCHLDMLDLREHGGDLSSVIDAANAQGVTYLLCVSVNLEDFPGVLHVAKSYVNVVASVGVHPNEQKGHEPSVDELVRLASDPLVVAVGETGLDYYRSEGDLRWQRDRFRRHLQAAIQVDKPVIIHSRDAREDTLQIMKEEHADRVGGVMHCFTETWEMAEAAMALGFYISFSGIVTFKNAKALQEVALKIPLNRMLIETDSPYLAPMPHRGKQNEPAYVRHVAEFLAELKNVTLEELACATTQNFFRLFRHAKTKESGNG